MKERILQQDDKIVISTTYDNTNVLEANKRQKNEASEFGRYKTDKTGLVHVGRVDEGDIVRLRNMGYNLLSSDKDEVKRALLFIQSEMPALLTKPGKPIAKKKLIWT